MTSDSTAAVPDEARRDAARAERAARDTGGRLWWRGIVCGGLAGLVVGVLDALSSQLAGNEVVGGEEALGVALTYALVFAAVGLLTAVLLARWFEWSRRATALLIAGGSALFFAGALMNIRYLPDFLSAQSLLVDFVLVGLAVVWFRRAYHGPGDDEVRWPRWFACGGLALVAALIMSQVDGREDGPQVLARATPESTKPNVLIFMVDTLRADALGCYGYEKNTSPAIDAFAADAVLFEDCRAPTSWTKPSVASMFTSLYPTAHACAKQRQVLVPEAETLAEVFRAAGWRTAAWSDNPFISPDFGLDQGFEQFDAVKPSVFVNGTLLGKVLFMLRVMSLDGTPFGVGVRLDRGAEHLVGKGVLPWIESIGDEPWFAYVHTMEPHLPYEPPAADAELFGVEKPLLTTPPYNGVLPFQTAPDPDPAFVTRLRKQYDGEVHAVSREFGRVIASLRESGELEETIVVFVSDHGEEFHDHGGWTHGHSLHREVVHVPLIVRVPAAIAGAAESRGRRIEGTASLLDVFPTLMEVAGVRYPKGGEHMQTGLSLAPQLLPQDGGKAKDRVPGKRVLLAEVSSGPVELRSIRDGRWLMIRATDPLQSASQLFDVVSDPGEKSDRGARESLTLTQMEARLTKMFDALDEVALTARETKIEGETRKHLEAIGYVVGGGDK